MLIFPVIYIFTPFIDNYSLMIPETIRVLGIILFLVVIISMWWVLKTLNINFDSQAQNRFVVSSGPYKYIRHPMYLVFIIQAFTQGLITSNTVIFIGFFSIILLVILRIRYEEQLLIQEFGEKYLKYKKTTKRIIPKLW
ncbi:MAG: isoprenylcysteine carboxylmethyltransferase family protein, partial [Candidatus Thorarchaeota archaeon]